MRRDRASQCQEGHLIIEKNSVETGSYSEAVFRRVFLAPAFSINFGLWRFTCVCVCSVSWLQLTLFDFWPPMIPLLHVWQFWFCVFLDTRAQIFQPSLLHACDRYPCCVEASLSIYFHIHLCLYVYILFILYVHVCTVF